MTAEDFWAKVPHIPTTKYPLSEEDELKAMRRAGKVVNDIIAGYPIPYSYGVPDTEETEEK